MPSAPVGSSSSLSFAGVLLGGGLSSRMGTNKALLSFAGKTLWERQATMLAQEAPDDFFVSLRLGDDWLPDRGVSRVFDDGAMGPLGGILAAFDRCRATHLIVLAVDLPQLPGRWFSELRQYCALGVGAVGRHSGSGKNAAFEPLAAIYPLALVREARSAASRGEFSLQKLAAEAVTRKQLREVTIADEQRWWFENWNTPDDLPAQSSKGRGMNGKVRG